MTVQNKYPQKVPTVGPRTKKVMRLVLGPFKKQILGFGEWFRGYYQRKMLPVYLEVEIPEGEYVFFHELDVDFPNIVDQVPLDVLDDYKRATRVAFPNENEALAFYIANSDRITEVRGFKSSPR